MSQAVDDPDRPDPETPGDEVGDDTAEVPAELVDEVGQALALREQAVAPVSAIPLPAEWNAMEVMATRLANSRVVPEAYRGRPDDVIAAWMFGREIGLGQMTALRDIYMVDGRAAIAAHRQLGLLRRGGVRILESDATDERAYIVAQRIDTGEIMRVEFTMEEAARITRRGKRLIDGDNWRSYPKDMLWARCVGRLTRRFGPDLIGGLPPYVAEEIADFSGWGVEYGGADDALTLVPAQKKRSDSWIAPTTWPDLGKRMTQQLGGADDWDAWRVQILAEAYAADSVAQLDSEKRGAAWKSFTSLLNRLEEHERAHELEPIPRATIQRYVAESFVGVAVAGPPWRLSPDETDQPVHTTAQPQDAEEDIEDAVIVDVNRPHVEEQIDKLLIEIDKTRGVKRTTTYGEVVATFGNPSEIDDHALAALSVKLSGYSMLGQDGMSELSFADYCAQDTDVEF